MDAASGDRRDTGGTGAPDGGTKFLGNITTHQKLRAERAGYPDDDDDPAAPPAPATKPAAANAPVPMMSTL
jgi:hypothetical protein